MRHARHSWPAALIAAAVLSACTDEPEIEVVGDVLDLRDVVGDAAARNACTGLWPLQFEGSGASPGDACGPCGDGALVCSGPDDLTCIGASIENGCGACTTLPFQPGSTCGTCSLGTAVCTDEGGVECAGDRATNACGGCGVLAVAPETECGTEREPASWRCVDLDEVRCVRDDANACGGETTLEGAVGDSCGACGLGVLGCEGTDAFVCRGDERGLNACGGCAPLEAAPDTPCGECGGTWACDGEAVACSIERNACGGCGDLSGVPGDACEGGILACEIGGDVSCVDPSLNACGGPATLDNPPGSPCGECGDGQYICSGPDTTACVGDTATRNSCDTCSILPGEPGTPCGSRGTWVCDAGTTVCSVDIGLNACGGTDTLDSPIGVSCGLCGSGVTVCAGANAVRCDGEDDPSIYVYWRDGDDDTFGAGDPFTSCEPVTGYVQNDEDCDDTSDQFYPGAPEDECLGTADFNCDGTVLYTDADNDGSPACLDCDDNDRRRVPAGTEVCDDIDNDCDSEVDEGIGRLWYRDVDGDGWGVEDDTVRLCDRPDGYVARVGDCEDDEANNYPGNAEVCDDIDNDCDTLADGDTAIDRQAWFPDRDEDGFASSAATAIFACDAPEGHITTVGDCNDDDFEIKPGASEYCDLEDNNCNGNVDELALDREFLQPDVDLDGFGGFVPVLACPGPGYVSDSSDCNDGNATVYPGAFDRVADGVDQDCDGLEVCLFDVDGDSFVGDFDLLVETSITSCEGTSACPDGVTPYRGDGLCELATGDNPLVDCDDADPLRSPAATEQIGDSFDSDCDGTEICLPDFDDDGYLALDGVNVSVDADCYDSTEGTIADQPGDCNDFNATTSPTSTEFAGDLVDSNCDGLELCYIDADNDLHRLTTTSLINDVNCTRSGFEPASSPADDCDDTNPLTYPGATEIIANGVDNTCDGQEICYVDSDRDGWPRNVTQLTTSVTCPTNLSFARNPATPGDAIDIEVTWCDEVDNFGDLRRPDATDLPDLNAFDSNCDYYDGNAGSNVVSTGSGWLRGSGTDLYVEVTADAATNGLRLAAAYAAAPANGNVLFPVGDYQLAGTISLRSGVGLHGGYSTAANIDGVTGSEPFSGRYFGQSVVGPPSGSYGADTTALRNSIVRATATASTALLGSSVSSTTALSGMRIIGGTRSGSDSQPSIAVRLVSSPGVSITQVAVVAGNGAAGSNGSGGVSRSFESNQNGSSRSGGWSSCGGGGGGYGATGNDSACSFGGDSVSCPGFSYYSPTSGGAGSGGGAGGARATTSNTGDKCDAECDAGDLTGNATSGSAGFNGTNGACGSSGGSASAATAGTISGGTWVGSSGGSGAGGTPGGGGGGGGGGGYYCARDAGGFVCGNSGSHDYAGGAGGGGGAGGCGGGGGQGGGQGGASIAILLSSSAITITGARIELGRGGAGGNAGSGGTGSAGGAGAGGVSGGSGCPNGACRAAGDGALGGTGGDGGGGAGGAAGNGGPAIGIAHVGGTPTVTSPTYSGGTAGGPGARGNGASGGDAFCAAGAGATGVNGAVANIQAF
jgi:hypothetical protein